MIVFELKNIQSIKDARIEIGEHNITEFFGHNSNGKSIITKVLEAMTASDLRTAETRNALIRDGCDAGVFVIATDTKELCVLIARKISDSRMMYIPVKGANRRIVLPISDMAGCNKLMYAFGFRIFDKGNICLQIAPTFGAIPFVTTSSTTNFEIADAMTVDTVAREFLSAFKNITFPAFKNMLSNLSTEENSLKASLQVLDEYDWRAFEDIWTRMNAVYSVIKNLEPIQIESIKVPIVDVIPVASDINIPALPVVEFYNTVEPIEVIGDELNNLVQILDGVCPTCGRPFSEDIC